MRARREKVRTCCRHCAAFVVLVARLGTLVEDGGCITTVLDEAFDGLLLAHGWVRQGGREGLLQGSATHTGLFGVSDVDREIIRLPKSKHHPSRDSENGDFLFVELAAGPPRVRIMTRGFVE